MAYKVLTLPDAAGRPVGFATGEPADDRGEAAGRRPAPLAADLSEADRRKNEFLAMLAHELRNPLAPISNAAHALRLSGGDGTGVRPASDMLDRQVGQMARLVDDLLDVSRISAARSSCGRSASSSHPSSITPSKPSARITRAGHELTVTLPPQPIYLDADPAGWLRSWAIC